MIRKDLNITNISEERCREILEEGLLASYQAELNPETNFPAFAFRVNQFISRGDTVYASLESELDRHITAFGQQYVPGNRGKVLSMKRRFKTALFVSEPSKHNFEFRGI